MSNLIFNKKWTLKHKGEVEKDELSDKIKISPEISQILKNRGIKDERDSEIFMNPSLDYLRDPFLMKDMDKAVERIKKAINNKARLVNFAEKVAGKTVAKNVNKFFTPITRALKPLLKWSEIPGQAVYDAIFRAIINAGGSRSVAANVANAVREVLEWTLF